MNASAVYNSRRPMIWWKRTFRWFSAVTGLFAAVGAATSVAAAPASDYRSAASAPAAWQDYARQLQGRFQQRLAAADDGARRFQEDMVKRVEGAAASPLMLIVQVWILPSGKIERIEFDGLDDDSVMINLRALLAGSEAGAPPPDMLQPLHLRLSLRAKDQPGQGE